MKLSDIPLDPSDRMLRQFAAAGFLVLTLLGLFRLRSHGFDAATTAFIATAALLGLLGVVRARWLKPIFVAATLCTFPFGWMMSYVILALMFFAILTPVGLFFRMRGRDILALRRPSGAASYWTPKPRVENAGRYFQQY